jgi:hypothetical protein
MVESPHIAFVAGDEGLSQSISAEHASLSGARRDLRLVLDGRPRHVLYKAAYPADGGAVEAIAEREEIHVETRLTPRPGRVDVVSRLTALKPIRLSSFEHAYAAHGLERRGALDDLWIPHLKGGANRVIGRHVFRSPCIVAQRQDRVAALVPNLDALEGEQLLPPVLDFERPATLRLGIASHRAAGEGAFERTPGEGVLLQNHESLALSFSIFLAYGVAPRRGLGTVLRYLWKRFGEPRLEGMDPQRLCFDDLARYAYDNAFERYDLWRDVFIEEGTAGGFAVRTLRPALRETHPVLPKRYQRRVKAQHLLSRALPWRQRLGLIKNVATGEADHIHFSTWFNQLRTAYGMAHFARKWGDEKLADAAAAIVRLALAAPVERGLFPAAYVGTPDRPAWLRGTRAHFIERRFALTDLCESARWMIALATDLGFDDRLIARARALGETLLEVQNPQGAVPAWLTLVRGGRVRGAGPLRAHAPTAMAGSLLARLARSGGGERFLAGARAAATHVVQQVWPKHAWLDFETLFSASTQGGTRWRDRQTGLPPQNTLSMSWAVDLLLTLRELGEPGWLDPALAILDELLLYQQLWDAPFLRFDTRGGFGVMNTDAAWSDARQALFVPLLLRTYDATGKREYALRAAAALRASFTLMLVPENADVAPGNTQGMTEQDYGATAENYGRSPADARPSAAITFDWGSGTACTAAAWVQRRYGDVYVDFSGRTAFGLNACRVREARITRDAIDLALDRLPPAAPMHRTPLPRETAEALLLRAGGLSLPRVRVRIDGEDRGLVDLKTLREGLVLPPSRR